MPERDERRRHSRVHLDGQVSGRATVQPEFRVVALSLGGALLALGSSLEVGAVHEFDLDLGARTLKVQGQVRHCRPADRYTGYHVGVSFIAIDPHDQELLGEYLGGH